MQRQRRLVTARHAPSRTAENDQRGEECDQGAQRETDQRHVLAAGPSRPPSAGLDHPCCSWSTRGRKLGRLLRTVSAAHTRRPTRRVHRSVQAPFVGIHEFRESANGETRKWPFSPELGRRVIADRSLGRRYRMRMRPPCAGVLVGTATDGSESVSPVCQRASRACAGRGSQGSQAPGGDWGENVAALSGSTAAGTLAVRQPHGRPWRTGRTWPAAVRAQHTHKDEVCATGEPRG